MKAENEKRSDYFDRRSKLVKDIINFFNTPVSDLDCIDIPSMIQDWFENETKEVVINELEDIIKQSQTIECGAEPWDIIPTQNIKNRATLLREK